MKIYSVSTSHYYAFGALVSEELSYKLKDIPGVRWVLPDSYLDVKNKDYGYPYEEMLKTFHEQINEIMCSYLPDFPNFNRTRGGLIQLNHGRSEPLQYVVNVAFLAALYSDYLEATLTPGWQCRSKFYPKEAFRDFAQTQINYILGKNPRKMSYVVGFTDHFPQHVHHKGASIPSNIKHQNCPEGLEWRDSKKPNQATPNAQYQNNYAPNVGGENIPDGNYRS